MPGAHARDRLVAGERDFFPQHKVWWLEDKSFVTFQNCAGKGMPDAVSMAPTLAECG